MVADFICYDFRISSNCFYEFEMCLPAVLLKICINEFVSLVALLLVAELIINNVLTL